MNNIKTSYLVRNELNTPKTVYILKDGRRIIDKNELEKVKHLFAWVNFTELNKRIIKLRESADKNIFIAVNEKTETIEEFANVSSIAR